MNVLDLKATIGIDSSEYDKGLDAAKGKLSAFGGALKTGLATAAKVTTAAVAAGSAAVAGLTKAAVTNYAEYEQLVGGVETLFGAGGRSLEQFAADTGRTVAEAQKDYDALMDAQYAVMGNADAAYKTAGLSANEYMETVTGFSASLLQGLGGDTVKAAEVANRAVIDMSDNANKMGTDVTAIQNAYQGFAKQNYTMLDNLKLGYGGTKTEMERLIKDASSMTTEMDKLGITVDKDSMSFDNIINAISVMQEHLGIAGTTAKEASETISGSFSAMKAQWDNLLTAMSQGEDWDLSVYINNLVGTVETFVGNILPVIEKSLVGIGELVQKVAPMIIERIPGIVSEIVPPLISAAWQMVTTLGTALVQSIPQLLNYINQLLEKAANAIANFNFAGAAQNLATKISDMFGNNNVLSKIIANGAKIVSSLVSGIGKALPQLLPAAMDIISSLITDLTNQVPQLINAAVDLVIGLAQGLTNPASFSNIINAAIQLVMKLADGIVNNLPKLTAAAPVIVENLVQAIVNNLPKLLSVAVQIVVKLELGIIRNLPTLVKAAAQIVGSLVSGIVSYAGKMFSAAVDLVRRFKDGIKSLNPAEWGRDMIDKFVSGIRSAIGRVKSAVSSVASIVRSYLHFSEPDIGPLADFHTYAPDMMKLFAKGMADSEDIVAKQMEKSFTLPEMSANIEASGGRNIGNVTINVYGAEGQSEERLVEIIQNKMLHQFNQQRAVSYA